MKSTTQPLTTWLSVIAVLLAAALARADVVTNTNASGAGSLRAVVAAAAPAAVITFAPALSGQTINLGGSQIVLDKNVFIDATALPQGIHLTQPPLGNRIVEVTTGAWARLLGLRMSGGMAMNLPYRGGAILNHGTLTLTGCTLEQNTAAAGGAIYNQSGTLYLNQCTFVGNTSFAGFGGSGGALYNDGGSLAINQCTLTGNSVTSYDLDGGMGAAVYNSGGSLAINQSTITANQAWRGPDVMGHPSSPGDGGGVHSSGGSLVVFNSIVAGNIADVNANIAGGYTTAGSNLLNGDPLLLPLGNFGGPTATMPPHITSPAIDTGSDLTDKKDIDNNGFLPTLFLFPMDQRGRPRLFGAHVDIGAVELQGPIIVTNVGDAGPGSLRQAIIQSDLPGAVAFAPALSGQSIQLQSALSLTADCMIDASALPGGILLVGSYRVLEVAANATVELRSLALLGGFDANAGSGILNQGNLTLDRCTVANNGGSGEIITTTGGGIYNSGRLTLSHCTVTGNRAAIGGGIYNHASGTIVANHCTIADNLGTSSTGGVTSNGNLSLANSIVAGNQGGGIVDTDLASFSLTTPGTNLVGGNPMLAPLGTYGGPTMTMALLPGSPARNATTGSTATTDQRGYPIVGTPDIGAYEAGTIRGFATWAWETHGAPLEFNADEDQDGAINGLEYATRRDPIRGDMALVPEFTPVTGGGHGFRFRYQKDARDLRYIVQRSADLGVGSAWVEIYRYDTSVRPATETENGVTGEADANTGIIDITDPSTSSSSFWRLLIQRIP